MTPAIRCPSCNRLLDRVHPDGVCQVSCSSCRQRFGVVYGKLSGWFSNREAMLYLTPRLPSFYKRHYDLRVTTPGRNLKRLRFSMPGHEDRVPVRPGDRISIVYKMRGTGMEKLVAIYNHTLGKNYYLPSPVPSSDYLLTTRGALSAVLICWAVLNGLGGFLTYGLGAIALLVYARLVDVAELTTPPLRPTHSGEVRLAQERDLLDQKFLIERRIETLRQERSAHQDLIQRLQSLRGKMMALNPAFYATRVASIESAVRLLKQRIHQDQRLVDEYTQTTQMIEIELESAYLADQLPLEDFTETILSKLDELMAIEERNRNLGLQLEANDEVRRLSFGASGNLQIY